ncbi:cation:proton antiporter [Sulfurisphaera javensis]|uniref:Cation:proton antiporter n=1 Tax=Sulfurisphaera javensis TaxID=2049879 RepID=A0AAT9GMW1_9CREN
MSLLVVSLLYLGIMLILAKLAEELFGRLNLVRFVGPILVGIILGNGVLNIVKINVIISFITSLGIVFLLFIAGAEELGENLRVEANDYFSSIIELAIPFTLISLVLLYLNEFTPLLVIPLAMTSAGPLTRLLIDLGLSKEKLGLSLFYQSVLNEIIAVILFAIFSKFQLINIISIILIVIFIFLGGSKIAKILELIEGYIKVREIEFATIISVIFIVGYIAESFSFNSAITALFLGFLLRDYLRDRPHLLERLRGFTYGFFEPLFFVSIGLYFVRISLQLLFISLFLFSIVVASKFASGVIASYIQRNDPLINGLGTSVKGGVDVSLLISALTLNLINSYQYSFTSLAITFSSLFFPLLFRLKYGKPKVQEVKVNLQQPVINIIKNQTVAYCTQTLRQVINVINEKGYRAIVVVDDNYRPFGYISITQLLEIDPSYYEILKVCDIPKNEIKILDKKTKVIDVLKFFRETEEPVVVIVDEKEKLMTVVYERELLRHLTFMS